MKLLCLLGVRMTVVANNPAQTDHAKSSAKPQWEDHRSEKVLSCVLNTPGLDVSHFRYTPVKEEWLGGDEAKLTQPM